MHNDTLPRFDLYGRQHGPYYDVMVRNGKHCVSIHRSLSSTSSERMLYHYMARIKASPYPPALYVELYQQGTHRQYYHTTLT